MKPNVIHFPGRQDANSQVKAMVKGVANDGLLVDTGVGVVKAIAAFSCLVAPEVDDIVLVTQLEGDYFVLAVLERPSKQDITLSFPANVKMKAVNGQIDLVASKDINILTSANTQLLSAELNMTSASMNVQTGKLSANTQEIESHSKTIKLYTGMLTTVAKQISQRTDILVRWVESVETLNIGNLIQKVRKNYTSHSDQAVMTAKNDMRIDADRIHMG